MSYSKKVKLSLLFVNTQLLSRCDIRVDVKLYGVLRGAREAIGALKRSIERWRWPLSIGAGHPLLKMLN